MTDDQVITSALKILFEPGDVFEIRILDAERPGARWPHVESGYFEYEHIQDVPQTLTEITTALGIYVTLNPVNPALLARAKNRIKRARQNETTRDVDILSRRWLLIDIDPARPAGISATDAEKEAAFDKALEIEAGLKSMQWPEPLIVDSGNGFYLMYRVDLPADDDGLIQRCIQALQPVATDAVHVDIAVHNPARICRLPGTWNRKGEDIPDRPHRISEIIQVPESITIVSDQLLQDLAGSAKATECNRSGHTPSANTTAEAFNVTGDIESILKKHGWQHIGDTNDNQLWRRPGKETGTRSATYNGAVFYVFSTDAAPFKVKGYSRFGVYSLLEHGEDHAAASAALSEMGYGPNDDDVDISGICNQRPEDDLSISVVCEEEDKTESLISDPGSLPMELLRIPGFISEVMDFCLENAPTRNHAMAFCGAVALQSVLGARKVRDPADNRTNLYLIALAPTGSGKDTPREINSKLLEQIGMQKTLASRFASGESIEDKLAETPVVLCQTDEFDGILLQMKNARDGRVEAMIDRYKEVFTSSNKTIYTRCLAGKESRAIHQPSLTIFGSAVPIHYYSALSEKMLTDGFFSRTIAVEAPTEIEDQEPTIIDDLPMRIADTAAWWSQFNPTPGNLAAINPRAAVVPMTDEANAIIAEVRKYARQIQNEANAKNDVVTAAVWSRVRQMTRKLALIYAISVNHRNPTIDGAAMIWARDFVFHQAQRMVFMANDHVSENPFHAQCLKVIKSLRNEPGQKLARGLLLGKMKCKAKELDEILLALFEQGRIGPVEIRTKTKPAGGWELVF